MKIEIKCRLIFLFILLFSLSYGYSQPNPPQTGCMIVNGGFSQANGYYRVYLDNLPNVSGQLDAYGGSYSDWSNSSGTAGDKIDYKCVIITQPNTSNNCSVLTVGGSSPNRKNGKLVYFSGSRNNTSCPIDDYIPILLIGVGLFGTASVKRNLQLKP